MATMIPSIQYPQAPLPSAVPPNKAAARKGAPKGANPDVWRWRSMAYNAERMTGVPAAVLMGLVEVESRGKPGLTSSAGAGGITQFMPGTAKEKGVDIRPGHEWSQILGAAKYLKELGFDKDPELALKKYNAGPGNPQAAGSYGRDVLNAARKYGNTPAGHGGGVTLPTVDIGGGLEDAAGAAVDAATALPKFLGKLDVVFEGDFWKRVGLVGIGVALLLLAVAMFGRQFVTGQITNVAKTMFKAKK